MSDPASLDKQVNLGAACFRCRGFRHACDRRKPSCSRCHRRGINCVYPEAAPTLKKLQQVTDTLSDRVKKFGDRLKTKELVSYEPNEASSPFSESTISTYFEDKDFDDMMMTDEDLSRRKRIRKFASMDSFSVYPCTKCFKDLQQCDLTLSKCSRCEANGFDCGFKETEPKANHVSQVLTTMNSVMDQWQNSIDQMAQKTKDISAKANYSLKLRPHQTNWKITTTKKGLSMESNVNSYSDYSTLVDQFERTMTPESTDQHSTYSSDCKKPPIMEFDNASLLHSTSGFDLWNAWSHSVRAMPQDYPIDISQELTDNLVELYCRTPCCSSTRLPIIDTTDFLACYRNPDPTKRPEMVLVYAVCAMAARNAFQLHVWSKRPSFQAPQYNMGKALSVAYSLRSREELSACFDEPTFERCQAAFLLSYCNYQNGYTSVLYIYEWFAYTMAVQLGLYDKNRELTQYESMLVWCIYYCNAWYKAIQQGGSSGSSNGLSQCKPSCAIPNLIRRPDQTLIHQKDEEPNDLVIHYYVWNSWVYLIKLQVLRDRSLARLISYQSEGLPDTSLPQDLLVMQENLKEFHQSLPIEWRSPKLDDSPNNKQSCCDSPPLPNAQHSSENFKIDVKLFSTYSINIVNLHYNINQIILYQAFIPMDHIPSTAISIRCLDTSLNAAKNISQLLERMVQQKKGCHVPLVGFLFANIIYRKLLSYPNENYHELGKYGLLQSLEISKSSVNYTYDCEMARTLVDVMEQDIQSYILQRSPNNSFVSMDSSADSCTSPSVSSPPNYTSLDQLMKKW